MNHQTTRALRPLERQREIVALVNRQGDLTVDEACRKLGISEATARRDFAELSARGTVEKTWGGVRRSEAAPPSGEMLPVADREEIRSEEKERIAAAACDRVNDGDILFIDGGTTTRRMAPRLADRPVRILTNSILIAHMIDRLRRSPGGAEVFLTGGLLYPGSGLLVGPEAVKSIRAVHAHKTFLSVGGLDSDGGMNTNQLVVEGERAMMAASDQTLVLADSSKWNRREMSRAFSWNEIAVLISNAPPPGPLPRGVAFVQA